jgi:lambda family phage portal protein
MGILSRAKAAAAVLTGRHVSFDAGQSGRRLRSIPSSTTAVNQQIRAYGRTIVARSRYLAANNPFTSNARDSFVSSLVGAGIVPSPLLKNDPALKTALLDLWNAWVDQADADWLTDFYGLQALVAGEVFDAGECFLRHRQRFPQDGLLVPYQVQLLPSEMLPLDRNQDLGNGARIECGIEFDPIGRRVAYWFYRVHPGQIDILNLQSAPGETVRVPAEEVIHIYRPTRAGQIRGIPHTISALTTMALMDLYDDAELERKRTAALFAGFIKRPAPDASDHPLGSQTLVPPDFSDPLGKGTVGSAPVLEPGTMSDLFPGEEVIFSEPADVGGSYEPFQYHNLLRAAAGFGVPYAEMTGDLRRANFGSIRVGMLTFRRRMTALQHSIIAYQLCRPVWNRWLDAAVLAGALPISATEYARRKNELQQVKWVPPAWEWIDPLKDMEAEVLAVENRFKPRSLVIESQGYDPEEVDQKIQADQQSLESLGISPPPSEQSLPAAGGGGGGSGGGGDSQNAATSIRRMLRRLSARLDELDEERAA